VPASRRLLAVIAAAAQLMGLSVGVRDGGTGPGRLVVVSLVGAEHVGPVEEGLRRTGRLE
jgi:hypothetical protein